MGTFIRWNSLWMVASGSREKLLLGCIRSGGVSAFAMLGYFMKFRAMPTLLARYLEPAGNRMPRRHATANVHAELEANSTGAPASN